MRVIEEITSKHNWNLPTVCPSCGTKLIINNSGFPECPNESCIAKIEHQLGRLFDLLGIKAAGPAFISKAAEDCKSVSMPLKLLLTAAANDDKATFNEWAGGINGEKVLKQLRDFLWCSDLEREPKAVTPSMLCAMLDWTGLSVKQFDKIPSFSLTNALRGVPYDVLVGISGIGNETAEEMTRFWGAKKSDLEELSHFFNIEDPAKKEKIKDLPTICFTGTCGAYNRKELTAMCDGKYKVVDSITKDTNILACADPNSNSSKLQKAKKNGTKIISYEELLTNLTSN